jgi:hypothetical protein
MFLSDHASKIEVGHDTSQNLGSHQSRWVSEHREGAEIAKLLKYARFGARVTRDFPYLRPQPHLLFAMNSVASQVNAEAPRIPLSAFGG